MKEIQPIQTWYNGEPAKASLFSLSCSNDNLSTESSFQYSLFSVDADNNIAQQLQSGFVKMTGEDYDKWQTNEYAYNWAAAKLNLIIIGDYVPPVPVPPLPEITEPTTTKGTI